MLQLAQSFAKLSNKRIQRQINLQSNSQAQEKRESELHNALSVTLSTGLQATSNSLQLAYSIRRRRKRTALVIDKLAVRVPAHIPFTDKFSHLYTELHRQEEFAPFRESHHYRIVADLRPFGYDAILHLHCKHGKEANHKLELIDTGVKSYPKIVVDMEEVFAFDALNFEIMRLDLAVDVEGIPIDWFQAHTRIKYKRWIANLAVLPLVEMGMRGIQTLYFGKRPNLIRIYDKVAEYRYQYQRMLRKVSVDAEPPTFQEMFGVPETGYVLTRIEREMGGGKIPFQLGTVKELVNCPNFEPFDRLEFICGTRVEPNPENYTFMDYCAGMYLREKIQMQGMHTAMRFITRQSKRNRKWVLEKFEDFLPTNGQHEFNYYRLQQLYKKSVSRQLLIRSEVG